MNMLVILFSLILSQSVLGQDPIFYFSPQLTIRIAAKDVRLTRRQALGLVSERVDLKKALDSFLNTDSTIFLQSLPVDGEVKYYDYLNFMNLRGLSRKGIPNNPMESIGCNSQEVEQSSFQETLKIGRQAMLISQMGVISKDATKSSLNIDAYNSLISMLGFEGALTEKTNLDEKTRKQSIERLSKAENLNRFKEAISSGKMDSAVIDDGIALIKNVNVNGQMAKEMLSDVQLDQIRQFQVLSKEEQIAAITRQDNTAVGVVLASAAAGYLVYKAYKSLAGTLCNSRDYERYINYRPDDFFDNPSIVDTVLDRPYLQLDRSHGK